MNLCSNGHDEVCYEGPNCPVCCAIADSEGTINDLEVDNDDLERQIDELLAEKED